MKPPSARIVDGKKFMWDGAIYPGEAEAAGAAERYRQARFEVQIVIEGGAVLVFTRREAAAEPKS